MEFYNQLKEKPFIIAGPCAMEGRDMALELAEQLKRYVNLMDLRIFLKLHLIKQIEHLIVPTEG